MLLFSLYQVSNELMKEVIQLLLSFLARAITKLLILPSTSLSFLYIPIMISYAICYWQFSKRFSDTLSYMQFNNV